MLSTDKTALDRTDWALLVLSTGKIVSDRTESASVVLSKAGGGSCEAAIRRKRKSVALEAQRWREQVE